MLAQHNAQNGRPQRANLFLGHWGGLTGIEGQREDLALKQNNLLDPWGTQTLRPAGNLNTFTHPVGECGAHHAFAQRGV